MLKEVIYYLSVLGVVGAAYFQVPTMFMVSFTLIIIFNFNIPSLAALYFVTSLSNVFFAFPWRSGYAIVIMLPLALLLFRKLFESYRLKWKSFYTTIFMFVLLSLTSIAWSYSVHFRDIAQLLFNFGFIFLFSIGFTDGNSVMIFLQKLSVTSMIVLGTIIFLSFFYGDLLSFDFTRFSVMDDLNYNRFGMMTAQLMFFSVFGVIKLRQYKILALMPLLLGGLLLIFLSGSRTSLVAFVLAIIYIVLPRLNLKTWIYITMGILLFVRITPNVTSDLRVKTLERYYLEDIEETGGSGRFEIWSILVPEVLRKSPLLGIGYGSRNVYEFAHSLGVRHSAHNMILDVFIQLGIGGVFTFTAIIFTVIQAIRKILVIKIKVVMIGGVIFYLVLGLGETIFVENFFWNFLALAGIFHFRNYGNVLCIRE